MTQTIHAAFVRASALLFAAVFIIGAAGCGPGFPIVTREQEALNSNVEKLLKDNEALTRRVAELEASIGAKKEMTDVKKGLVNALVEMEKLRQEFSFVQGTIESTDNDKKKASESLKSALAALTALNERVNSLDASVKDGVKRDEAVAAKAAEMQESIDIIEKRLDAADGKTQTPKPSAKKAAKPGKKKPDEAYASGVKAIKAKDYDKAIEVFSAFVEDHQGHKLSGNASYWLGEAHYAKGDFEKAALEFDKAIKKNPTGDKAPGAMLRQAYSLDKLGMKKEARALMDDLVEKFPASQEAKKAKERTKGKRNGR